MQPSEILFRYADAKDLEPLNLVVEQAVMSWNLPDRVKRLALPSYRYSTFDSQHMQFLLAVEPAGAIVGVAAWETADSKESPPSVPAVLLHGIYILPEFHRFGIGSRLLQAMEQTAKAQQFEGVLVKAQSEAGGFFRALGYVLLPTDNPEREYQNRYWKALST